MSRLCKKMVPEKLLQDCFPVWCLREPCSFIRCHAETPVPSKHLLLFTLLPVPPLYYSCKTSVIMCPGLSLLLRSPNCTTLPVLFLFLCYSAISSALFWYSFLLLLLFIKLHYFCQIHPTACCTISHNFVFLRNTSHIFIFTFSFWLWSVTLNNPGVVLQAQYDMSIYAFFLCIGSFSSSLPSFLLNRMCPPSPQSDTYSL